MHPPLLQFYFVRQFTESFVVLFDDEVTLFNHTTLLSNISIFDASNEILGVFLQFLINIDRILMLFFISTQISHVFWYCFTNPFLGLWVHFLCPFHNWCTSTLHHFPIEFFSLIRALAYVVRCLAFVACILVVTWILFKIVDMHTIQTRSNAIKFIAMQRTNVTSTNVLQRFVYSQE